LSAVQSKIVPSNHDSKAEIPLMAGQTMKFKISIMPRYSETAGNLLSYEKVIKLCVRFSVYHMI
jgi:hypothetical protein